MLSSCIILYTWKKSLWKYRKNLCISFYMY